VGSLVSIVGVLLFFFIIYDLFASNNIFFQLNNNTYIMALNSQGNTFSSAKGFYTNIVSFYVFNKYNFFNAFQSKFFYSYLDKLL